MMVSNASAHQMHAHSPHTCKVLHSKQRRDTAADLWSCLHATLAMLGVLASML
jgi:ribosomal protein L37AE/L43A